MRISTKGRYAMQLMLDLARYNTGEPISLKDISKRQEISEKYLEQIISLLNKGGFVRSVRGAQGGYLLNRDPKDYKVGEILRITEGDLAPVACLDQNSMECEKRTGCATVRLWQMIDDAVSSVVDKVTLQDLLDWSADAADTYVI
ncbi:MAG: Rrf2 family transcriptional regulator [Lachnospiraceae bacterium]|jgi:Rrf2 family protein|nr:Rrf2 family transcriptional regulator [Lachnospiraceae bacterium]MCI7328559.1 Rrf2 family transcriptional regulator [Lachnospiraceae bacterium]MDD7702868.1 Rrf2 family transcriptional regulator [Lachnospiraceae bacterium]MDY3300938.1 Rrf2 family transcriptional regulator [Lachnospiraceae bacterium]MEE3379167.1 Rrf2 family transcriptional regulator [Lachnospiraceae bacterium]